MEDGVKEGEVDEVEDQVEDEEEDDEEDREEELEIQRDAACYKGSENKRTRESESARDRKGHASPNNGEFNPGEKEHEYSGREKRKFEKKKSGDDNVEGGKNDERRSDGEANFGRKNDIRRCDMK